MKTNIYECTKDQYNAIINSFSGLVFHRKDENKYFVKTWLSFVENQIKLIVK